MLEERGMGPAEGPWDLEKGPAEGL